MNTNKELREELLEKVSGGAEGSGYIEIAPIHGTITTPLYMNMKGTAHHKVVSGEYTLYYVHLDSNKTGFSSTDPLIFEDEFVPDP